MELAIRISRLPRQAVTYHKVEELLEDRENGGTTFEANWMPNLESWDEEEDELGNKNVNCVFSKDQCGWPTRFICT